MKKLLNLSPLGIIVTLLIVIPYSCQNEKTQIQPQDLITQKLEQGLADLKHYHEFGTWLDTLDENQSSLKSLENVVLGANLTPQNEYEQFPIAEKPAGSGGLETKILSAPPAGDQGGEGSCVAWATAYCARSIEQRLSTGAEYSESVNIFSPEYVYNQIKVGGCEGGAFVPDALNLLKNQGVCRWSFMPYSDAGCYTLPNSAQIQDASNFKISKWSRVPIDVPNFIAHISAGHPIVVVGPVNQFFKKAKLTDKFYGTLLGYHAYCIIAYGSYGNDLAGFAFINSWGDWGYGSAGIGLLYSTVMTDWIKEAYVLY